jgi:prolyl 4-hydroxylase
VASVLLVRHAVLFFSLRTEGTLDKGSLHGSCPTLKGLKYAATK